MVLKYSRKMCIRFILNCTKGNLKIRNCCLYISSLLLINLYCTHDIRSEADAGLSMNSHHMAQHLCQTQLLLVWPVPRDNISWQVDGVIVSVQRATFFRYHGHVLSGCTSGQNTSMIFSRDQAKPKCSQLIALGQSL